MRHFFEKMTFQKKIKKWRIYARIESDHFFDFIFEKSDLFYIYEDLGSRWYLSKRILRAILQKNRKAPGMSLNAQTEPKLSPSI